MKVYYIYILTKEDKMKWSVSKLKTFQNCKRQFYKKYILYDPPENAEPEVYQAGHEFHAM